MDRLRGGVHVSSAQHILASGEYELDLGRNELRNARHVVELQATPLRLLLYLAEHRDRAVPGQELLEAIWPDALVTDTSLSRALTQVRQAVGDDGHAQRVIRTQKGVGYRFVAEVREPRELGVGPNGRRRRLAFAAGALARLVVITILAISWSGDPPPLDPASIRSIAVLPLHELSTASPSLGSRGLWFGFGVV